MSVQAAVNKKYRLRYISLIFLLISYIPLFLLLIVMCLDLFKINIPNVDAIKYTLFIIFFIIFLPAIMLLYVYINKTPLPDVSSIDRIKEYLDYFRNTNIKPLEYGDTIIWFSRLVRFQFLQKREENNEEVEEYTELINDLHRILRPDKHGLCVAYYHQRSFAKLSGNIVEAISNENIHDRIYYIRYEIDQILSEEEEKSLKLNKDKNMIYYSVLIVANIVGCLLLAGVLTKDFSASTFLGNIFLYIPTDIGLIIAYKDIIKKV